MAVKNFGKEMHLQAVGANANTLTKLAELLILKVPSLSVGTLDATTHDSVDGVMEFIGDGVADPGAGTATIHWVPGEATDTLVLARLASKEAALTKFIVNGKTAKYALTGPIIITSYDPDDAPVQGKQAATIGFKAAGKMTFAAVAP